MLDEIKEEFKKEGDNSIPSFLKPFFEKSEVSDNFSYIAYFKIDGYILIYTIYNNSKGFELYDSYPFRSIELDVTGLAENGDLQGIKDVIAKCKEIEEILK